MRKFIQGGPSQLVEAVDACRSLSLPAGDFERVLLLGMGGSALSGGLIDLVRRDQKCSWTFEVVRDYSLPFAVDRRTLVLALSYSGDTEETLAAFGAACPGAGCVVAVSSGGKLEKEAKRQGVDWIAVPPKPHQFQPRFALYFMFGVGYEVLCRCGLLRREDDLPALAASISALDQEEDAREIASRLSGRIPVVYTPPSYEQAVARIWKIKLNENSKLPAIAGAIPEANHNELVAFRPDMAGDFAFLFLPDRQSDPRILRRFDLMRGLLVKNGYEVVTVPLVGSAPLEKCLTSLKLADWVTYHLALSSAVDPIAIPAIQEFKKLL